MKKAKFFLLPTLVALLLSACGGGGGETEPINPDTEPSEDEPSEPVTPSDTTESHLITFKDENGNVLDSKEWEEGTTPYYSYEKIDTVEWDYTMEGWSLSAGGEVLDVIPVVTAPATYHAIVTSVKQRYTITFNSKGGSSVEAITADYGSQIEEPDKPTMEGFKFVGWSYETNGSDPVEWPLTVTKDDTLYANWNEKVDIKGYLQTLINSLGQDPYSYIPSTMQPKNVNNHVEANNVAYDFNNFNNVSDITYGGYGEQWHMVIENINESQRFYNVLSIGEAMINSSVVLFNNFLDNNTEDTATHTLNETEYTAKLNFENKMLTYTLQYKTGLTIPFFGEVFPQIDMVYDIESDERTVRIQLTENNAIKYAVTDNSYVFAIQYGVEAVSRKAYFQICRDENDNVEGHIYEFVQFKDKDMVPACADFYIGEEYTSVVGNKASGMPGFTGFINELYETDEGKLLGYEVRETFEKWGFEKTYHTLWFNLNNISGISSVKAVDNGNTTFGLGGENNHDIYLNGSSELFEPTHNKVVFVETSRKYDVELRKQFFYGLENNKIVEYETEIPMMFIQADHDDYTNFSDFPSDIKKDCGITASVNLASKHLAKIQSDYATLIDVFILNKENVTGATIENYIGDAIVIA